MGAVDDSAPAGLSGIAQGAVVISGERRHELRAGPAPGFLHHTIVPPRDEYPAVCRWYSRRRTAFMCPCARRPQRGAARRLADRAAASAEGTDGGLPPGRPDFLEFYSGFRPMSVLWFVLCWRR